MRKYIQSISILLIFIQLGLSSDKLTANQFVENSIKRLDNIDCKMIINGKSIEGKGKEEKTSFVCKIITDGNAWLVINRCKFLFLAL